MEQERGARARRQRTDSEQGVRARSQSTYSKHGFRTENKNTEPEHGIGERTYTHLILNAGDVEHRLDLLPQLEPHPVAQLHVLAQIALHHLQSQPAEWKSPGQRCTRET